MKLPLRARFALNNKKKSSQPKGQSFVLKDIRQEVQDGTESASRGSRFRTTKRKLQLIDGMLRSFLSRKRRVPGKFIEVRRWIRRNERRKDNSTSFFMLEGAEHQKQVGLWPHYQPSLRLLLKLQFSRILASKKIWLSRSGLQSVFYLINKLQEELTDAEKQLEVVVFPRQVKVFPVVPVPSRHLLASEPEAVTVICLFPFVPAFFPFLLLVLCLLSFLSYCLCCAS